MSKELYTERLDKRYRSLGGLPKAISRFKDGAFDLRTIAKAASCSPETVRNDFKRHLGAEGYYSLLNNRASTVNSGLFNSQAAQALLEAQLSNTSENKAQRISVFIQLLREADKAGVGLFTTISPNHYPRFMLANNLPVKVNVAIPGITHNQREHLLGLHKFDVDSSIRKYQFVIYVVHALARNVFYIFRTREIRKLQTITLRFELLEKTSRYDYARNNWTILLSAY